MKASEILRKAAEEVVEGGMGGCSAINHVCDYGLYTRDKRRAYKYYASLFKNGKTYWFGDPADWGNGTVKTKNQNHRALALLLTADIAESIGD